MIRNILLEIAYDGTNYHGWQRQKNALSVQQVVEEACSKIFKEKITITGASRTDTMVHALGQRATLRIDTSIPIDRVPFALNSQLPDDIVVCGAEEKSLDFHPRYDVKKKTYQYKILNDLFPVPQLRNYTAYQYEPLDSEAMKEASKYFKGTYNFIGFCSSGSSVASTVRTIYDISVSKEDNLITMNVTGNGFLYNMVRIMVGTLLLVGKNKIHPNDMPGIIQSKDRTRAGPTAPPQGLTLLKIFY